MNELFDYLIKEVEELKYVDQEENWYIYCGKLNNIKRTLQDLKGICNGTDIHIRDTI